jgi:hypothetical protein
MTDYDGLLMLDGDMMVVRTTAAALERPHGPAACHIHID